jgi:hypothetical protein
MYFIKVIVAKIIHLCGETTNLIRSKNR